LVALVRPVSSKHNTVTYHRSNGRHRGRGRAIFRQLVAALNPDARAFDLVH